jgi:predicted nucleotidyltransferase
MSGNFVQRGEPAIIDKWTRTKMALESGIDLVLELPVIYSLSSAEFFSHGAITILNKLNIVNNLCFGSECGDITILNDIASILVDEPEAYKKILKANISTGITYPKARSIALAEYYEKHLNKQIEANILSSSNNILGIEYCKSLLRNKSNIKPYTIQRVGGSYNSKTLNETFSSATAIREIIKENKNLDILKHQMPEASFSILKNISDLNYFTFPEDMYTYIKYKLLQKSSELKNLPDISEGLDNRIYSSIANSRNYEDFINTIKTKRYTYTRITRCLCQLFIGFEAFDTDTLRKSNPEYVKILGFNPKGAAMLKEAKKTTEIEILTKVKTNTNPMLSLDLLSTKMYSLINTSVSPLSDFKIGPIIY